MLSIKVTSVTPLRDMRLLVTFENGVAKLFDVRRIVSEFPEYAVLENPDIFNLVRVESGGYGVSWSPELDCSEGELWDNGNEIPLTVNDLLEFIRRNTLITAEAANMLKCSKQNIEDLTKRNKLIPLRSYSKGKLFFSGDIQNRASF